MAKLVSGQLRPNLLALAGICYAATIVNEASAGASGPTVGNPNVNEAAEEPEPRTVSTTKRSLPSSGSSTAVYGVVEGQHHTTDYYDTKGERTDRKPSLHGRMQIGARVYQDKVDLSLAVGAVKVPATQALYQKRPELIADVYPIKGKFFNLLWYNMLQFPVSESQRDPTEFSDQDRYSKDALRGVDATVFTLGLAPAIKTEWRMPGGLYSARLGVDARTKAYSKPLYIDDADRDQTDVGLVGSGEEPIDKPFEDRAMRFSHQETAMVGVIPNLLPTIAFDVGATIETRYIPEYFRDEVGGWDYAYKPEKISFWRFKLALDVSPTWTVSDEVYTFREGFFARDRALGSQRFKNIVKIAAKL